MHPFAGVLFDIGEPGSDVYLMASQITLPPEETHTGEREKGRGGEKERRKGSKTGRNWVELTLEGSFIGHIVDEKDSHRTAIVCRCDGAETFLASRIPYLKLHSLAVQLDCTNFEVDSDGSNEGGGE